MTARDRLERLRNLSRSSISGGFASANEFMDWQAKVQALLDFNIIHQSNFRAAASLIEGQGGTGSMSRKMLQRMESILRQSIAELELEAEGDESYPIAVGPEEPATQRQAQSRKIFVVHGHNESTKEATARFLTQIETKPIILHEQPNQGRTLIEKFEANADVEFAVVILTADDHGGPKDCNPEELQPRARQNVILELGYFMARLSRARVCALYEEGVEIPSDYRGVVFVKLDSAGAWKGQLAKEVDAAGIAVDFNKVLKT